MTVKELREHIVGIPDEATVFIECDHGQNKEKAYCFVKSRNTVDSSSDPDDMIFEGTTGKKPMIKIL